MTESILHIQDKPKVDESIREYEYMEYQPISGSQLNTFGWITITVENTDDFQHPRYSWLLVEGDLVKAGNGRYQDADLIALRNNALVYLFKNISYSFGGMEIESLNHPGFATTMLGLVKYSLDYAKGPRLIHSWYPDTTAVAEEM